MSKGLIIESVNERQELLSVLRDLDDVTTLEASRVDLLTELALTLSQAVHLSISDVRVSEVAHSIGIVRQQEYYLWDNGSDVSVSELAKSIQEGFYRWSRPSVIK